MIYKIQINKHIRNIRVYEVKKKMGNRQNILTKAFMHIFNRREAERDNAR